MQQHTRPIAKLCLAGILAVAPLTLAACGNEGSGDDSAAGESASDRVRSAGDLLEEREGEDGEADAGDDADAGYNGSYDSGFPEQASALVGEEVTVSATVDQVVDPNSFSITGIEETSAEPLLVVGSDIAGVLEEGQVLLVTGTVQSGFDEAAVEEELGLDLTDDGYTDFAGQEYIVADSVDIQVPAEQE
ncbi:MULTISPECIES: hypothetical protein [unclassified Modestobacter]|uniref:hypothetical protein n=1 Tax=unclassified Modestobacter TaxID=2643866 RepID=UPI0022AA66C1|nr:MULTISPECIES: hypothetical protein [unclassified Modestobacter]MCZ2810774.1 hypothetical protein [Modestobacter sp. VKM Ac-2979]MCZ2840287.1 hypothetical protein [Modestobacter sp. VKM Ac-2980]MCZ2849414.1 hypothetical protein [Modestobacter sp. VKM Ac-2978]